MSATIAEILTAKSLFLTRDQLDRDEYERGNRYRCHVRYQGKEIVGYGRTDMGAWLVAFDASGAPSNLELDPGWATYRLETPKTRAYRERDERLAALEEAIFGPR